MVGLGLFISRDTCEDIARNQLSANQEERSHQNPAVLVPDLGLQCPELCQVNLHWLSSPSMVFCHGSPG